MIEVNESLMKLVSEPIETILQRQVLRQSFGLVNYKALSVRLFVVNGSSQEFQRLLPWWFVLLRVAK